MGILEREQFLIEEPKPSPLLVGIPHASVCGMEVSPSAAYIPRRFGVKSTGDRRTDGIVKNDFHKRYITLKVG